MTNFTTQTTPRVTPALGDITTKQLATWLAHIAVTGRYPKGFVGIVTRRRARLADIRAELIRRETVGAGVR